MLRGAFSRSHPTHHLRVVIQHLLGVKTAFASSDSLHDDARILVNQHAHRAPSARATTFSAPSFIPFAMVKLNPDSRRICWPFSTLVPSILTTTGTLKCNSFAAFTTPLARTSQRR